MGNPTDRRTLDDIEPEKTGLKIIDDLLAKIKGQTDKVNKMINIRGEREERRVFETGAVRGTDVDHLRYDLIPTASLERLARRYGFGAEKYGDYNWQKGMPNGVLANHAMAHFQKWMAGDRTDDHLAAAAWGLFALMHFEEKKKKAALNRNEGRAIMDAEREDLNDVL